MQKNSFIAIVVVNKIQLKFNFIRDAERGFPLWLNKLLNKTEVFFIVKTQFHPSIFIQIVMIHFDVFMLKHGGQCKIVSVAHSILWHILVSTSHLQIGWGVPDKMIVESA